MLTVGLTGGIAGGKSTVAGYLAEQGVVIVDADLVAREVMSVGTEAYDRLVDHFGRDMLAPDGSIDSARLAAEVFNDPAQLGFLNRVVHPETIERIRALVEEWRSFADAGIGLVQVPLLFEAGMAGLFDVVVVVVTTPELQIGRLTERGLTIDQGMARLRSQPSDAQRLAVADFTLINKGDFGRLKEQTAVLYEKLKERAAEGCF